MDQPELETFDLRTLDLGGFRGWLNRQMERWQADPVFVQRRRIRDLRKTRAELRPLEKAVANAHSLDRAADGFQQLWVLERQLEQTRAALNGLDEALTSASEERRPSLAAKRNAYAVKRKALLAAHERETQGNPERQSLQQAEQALARLRMEIGLDREEAKLAEIQQQRGRGSGRAGSAFEAEALAIVRNEIIPAVAADPANVHVLQSVRLGAAGVELDFVVVRQTHPDAPVEVLAIAEAKRNINDLGHGFVRRQIDLAWLTGDTHAYEPAAFRTGTFTEGHFDRPALHRQDDRLYVFAPGSFGRFRRDAGSGYFLANLHFVTRPGPIWGLSAAALSQVAARVSTDERWDPECEPELAKLFVFAKSLAKAVETPEVVGLYERAAGGGLHVVKGTSRSEQGL